MGAEPDNQGRGQAGNEGNAPEGVPARDARLLLPLWSPRLHEALRAAEGLYAPDAPGEPVLEEARDSLAGAFWRVLMLRAPVRPESTGARREAAVRAARAVLKAARTEYDRPFAEDVVAVALRPVRRLAAGELTAELCDALHDFHRGRWNPHLTKPQRYALQQALARTLAALPPDALGPFWACLHSRDAFEQRAMLDGLDYLGAAHAVPQLLRGLEESPDHDLRAAIVDRLEQIADPRAIETLARLRRETAASDWPLSRQIARAVRVIEHQNRGRDHRALLRPADTPADPAALLRPAAPEAAPCDALPRPALPPERLARP